jgi:hypothetical protein
MSPTLEIIADWSYRYLETTSPVPPPFNAELI